MALIQCPECSKEVSSQAKKCPYCGYKINKKIRSTYQPKKHRLKLAFIVVISFFLISACGAGGYLGYKYLVVPMIHYNKAEAYLKNDKFENAIKEYKAAGKYKDASKKLKEAKYEWAEKVDVEKAIELYNDLGNFKDSKDKLANAEKEKEKQDALAKLQTAYDKCESDGVSLSVDKKSIIVDSTDQYDYLATLDILTIIGELGLPDSLYDEMCYTNALMGRQTEVFDYYEVSWSYHPDNGLDVIFKLRD